jgi:transcriptional regulator GlxA family with amidase domain
MENAITGKPITIGLVLFDRAEELDWVGPFEVFTMAREVAQAQAQGDAQERGPAADLKVVLVSQEGGVVRGAKGMRVEVDHSFADAPAFDVLLIPGGIGTRTEMSNDVMLDFLRKKAAEVTWLTSVCTGSAVLEKAGLAKGKRITTHWGYLPTLRETAGEGTTVLERVRYVRDGNLVTSAGVSAGIDMALWLTGQLFGVPHARNTQRAMEYDPAPPYTADA